MEITLTQVKNNQVVSTTDLTKVVHDLNGSLTALAPQNSETTRLITYVLVATAITGIFVYHYIKSQENL